MTAQLLSQQSSNLEIPILPQHVAVIMDGNGRWAKQKGLPRIEGHCKGANILKEILRTCKDYGISTLTTYAFSTENWNRPISEVSFLMTLFEKLLRQELKEMNREDVCLRFIGDLASLPKSLQAEIDRAINITKYNTGVNFNVAINYGSRWEISKACKEIAYKITTGELTLDAINETTINHHLDTANSPDPDLLIRTSGEMRISNFLLWQMAYTEIYVTDTFWPDFDSTEFLKAISEYGKRDRRFGKIDS